MEQVSGREDAAPARAPIVTRERIAVALLFLMNGYIFGGWAPKIPELPNASDLIVQAWG